jgi:hypothetical protein
MFLPHVLPSTILSLIVMMLAMPPYLRKRSPRTTSIVLGVKPLQMRLGNCTTLGLAVTSRWGIIEGHHIDKTKVLELLMCCNDLVTKLMDRPNLLRLSKPNERVMMEAWAGTVTVRGPMLAGEAEVLIAECLSVVQTVLQGLKADAALR